MAALVLVVDDDKSFCTSITENLERRHYRARFALNLEEARSAVQTEDLGFVLLDLILGDQDGLDLLRYIRSAGIEVPVVVMTGYSSVETAVEALKLGATDYVKKPINLDALSETIANHFEKTVSQWHSASGVKPLVTRDPEVARIVGLAESIAPTDIPVLITGENGTGKEVFAEFVCARSNRAGKKITKINCAAFSESLLDNELFGHEKGAYTGADSAFKGVFESADGGTILLDEIGDMSLSIQAKILRVLQNQELKRLGGNETIRVDVRFIAATNKNLEEEIRNGRFREDLYFRLNAATIEVPPLRQRTLDLAPLSNEFLAEANCKYQKRVAGLEDPVLELFQRYAWPGNVRELKNTIHFAVALCDASRIRLQDLPSRVRQNEPAEAGLTMTANEKQLIVKALQSNYYNKKRAAEALRISRNTLYNKMKKYGIQSYRPTR